MNQPRDMSYVITRLLDLSAEPNDLFSGLLDPHEIAAAGHSDGGDTGRRARGQRLLHRSPADGRRGALRGGVAPDARTVLPAGGARGRRRCCSSRAAPTRSTRRGRAWNCTRPHPTRARYYLDLLGADHVTPYTGTNPVERLVARVTLAFFNRYVLGQAGALATMTREGNVSGAAVLVSGSEPPP